MITPGQVALDSVTYPATTTPQDVQEAAIATAVALYRARGTDGRIASESLGDWSVTYRAEQGDELLPALARALLAPYRWPRVA